MAVSQVRRRWLQTATVRARRMKQALEQRRAGTEPRPPLTPLAARLAEWRRPHQRLARVGPSVRTVLLLVVPVQPPPQPLLELRRGGEVSPFQETPGQDAEEQPHLVQPRPAKRREVEDVPVRRVTQERPPLCC